MTTNLLTKGGNVALPSGIDQLRVGLSWEAPSEEYDLDAWTFMLGVNERVLSDEHFVFFNNPVSPCGTVSVSPDSQQGGGTDDDETVTVLLPRVPSEVQFIRFIVNIHEGAKRGQNFSQLDNSSIRLFTPDGQELARYNLGAGDVSSETSLVFGELYRHNGAWKFRAIAQGSDTGPAGLVRNYGVDVDDDEPAPATTPAMTKPVSKPVNLSKGKVNLTKPGESAAIAMTPEMEFSLYWTKSSKDLGLILLVTHKDGSKHTYDWRQLRDKLGEVVHHGDRKRGGGDVREYATLRFQPDTQIAAVAIAAYSEVSNGVGSFRSMGAHAVIDDGNGTKVTVDLNKGGMFSYHTVIATIVVNGDGSLTVNRVSRFSATGSEHRPEIDQLGNISMNTGPVVFK